MNKRTSVVIGSNHPVWVRGLVEILGALPAIDLAGTAECASRLRELLTHKKPDFAIIDARFVACIRAMERRSIRLPRVLVVGRGKHAGTRRAFDAQDSCGYLGEREAVQTLVRIVQEIARCPLPRAGTSSCAHCPLPRTFRLPSLPLSPREQAVFERIGWGLGPSEIALDLGIGTKTVETHRESIKRKLNVDSGARLLEVALAWRDGELPPALARVSERGEVPG